MRNIVCQLQKFKTGKKLKILSSKKEFSAFPSLHHLGRHISYCMCLYFMMSWCLTTLKLVWLTKTVVNIMKMGSHPSYTWAKNDQLSELL